jgi:hypothetical protein
MDNTAKSFDEEYMDYSQPAEMAEKEKFTVRDISSAEWCLKRIAWHQKHKADALAFVEAEKAKLDEYLAKVNSEENGSIEYFTELLKPFAMEQLQGSKKKTVTLPSGSLSFKKQSPEFVKNDEELLAFVKESLPEFVKIKESVDWGEMKKTCQIDNNRLVTADGEIVRGVTVNERDDTFTVKIKEKL